MQTMRLTAWSTFAPKKKTGEEELLRNFTAYDERLFLLPSPLYSIWTKNELYASLRLPRLHKTNNAAHEFANFEIKVPDKTPTAHYAAASTTAWCDGSICIPQRPHG